MTFKLATEIANDLIHTAREYRSSDDETEGIVDALEESADIIRHCDNISEIEDACNDIGKTQGGDMEYGYSDEYYKGLTGGFGLAYEIIVEYIE